MLGSLVIQSQGTPCKLPIFSEAAQTGSHTPGRFNGTWFWEPDTEPDTVYLPSRDKECLVYGAADCWSERLRELDTLPGPHYDKLKHLVGGMAEKGIVCINTKGVHGSWTLLNPSGAPLYVAGIKTSFDTQLVWADWDFIPRLRSYDINKYLVYRFGDVGTHLFINSQTLCSKWWTWSKASNSHYLKSFNALEVVLLKARR